MATIESTETTHEWTHIVESFNLIPHMSWSDTDLKKWHIMQINKQKSAQTTQKWQLGG